jgi:hypothetical protein
VRRPSASTPRCAQFNNHLMTTRFNIWLPLVVLALFNSKCTNKKEKSETNIPSSKLSLPKSDTNLPFLDTIVVIKGLLNGFQERSITSNEAQKQLYKHFRKKGVVSRYDMDKQVDANYNQLVVSYDTLYSVQSDKFSAAVISFWLGPRDLNGNCFQPSKAIIVNSDKGYKIIGENFIPTSFSVDSTKGSNIYGYEYECAGRGILRHFKIALQ